MARLYAGDLAIIMKMFERMDDRIKQSEVSLAAILKEIQVLQARSTCVGPPELVVHDRCTQPEPQSRSAGSAQFTDQLAAGHGVYAVNVPSWADMSENRFAVLETSEDDDRRPYSEVVSRRAKRRRNQSQQIASSQPQPQQQQPMHQLLSLSSSRQQSRQQPAGQQSQSAARPSQQQQQQRRQRSARLLTGKAVGTDRGERGERDRLGAAGKLINKAVFCIDNVDPSYDTDDFRAFVAGLSVTVFTCFPAESRRRRTDPPSPITNRKAFRLCIDDADRAALLNEDA